MYAKQDKGAERLPEILGLKLVTLDTGDDGLLSINSLPINLKTKPIPDRKSRIH